MSLTESAPRPSPSAISGASGPRTRPSPSVASAAGRMLASAIGGIGSPRDLPGVSVRRAPGSRTRGDQQPCESGYEDDVPPGGLTPAELLGDHIPHEVDHVVDRRLEQHGRERDRHAEQRGEHERPDVGRCLRVAHGRTLLRPRRQSSWYRLPTLMISDVTLSAENVAEDSGPSCCGSPASCARRRSSSASPRGRPRSLAREAQPRALARRARRRGGDLASGDVGSRRPARARRAHRARSLDRDRAASAFELTDDGRSSCAASVPGARPGSPIGCATSSPTELEAVEAAIPALSRLLGDDA